jgi:hypothetical protein
MLAPKGAGASYKEADGCGICGHGRSLFWNDAGLALLIVAMLLPTGRETSPAAAPSPDIGSAGRS